MSPSMLLALALLAPDGKSPPVRLLALGDSFTIGTGARPEQAFPMRLAEHWRAQGKQVEVDDPAVNGFSTRELIDDELAELRRFKPTLVTLAVGANDIVRGRDLDDYRTLVRSILDEIRAAGIPAANVWVLPQPDWSQSPTARDFGDPATYAKKIRAYNAALREEALAAGARWIDLFPLMEQQARSKLIAGDGLHPSAAAYDAWAERLAKER